MCCRQKYCKQKDIDWNTAGMPFFHALQDQLQDNIADDDIPQITQRLWTSDLQLPGAGEFCSILNTVVSPPRPSLSCPSPALCLLVRMLSCFALFAQAREDHADLAQHLAAVTRG